MSTELKIELKKADQLQDKASNHSLPVISYLLKSISDHFKNQICLLAVCPNSEAVTRAALLAGKQANAPVLFAATLNQVDIDGGYTGWTPKDLIEFSKEFAFKNSIDTPILACLDHGGPWLKDKHTKLGLSLEDTMLEVKKSLEACIDAGYALLHIDPTVDRSISTDEPIPIDIVVDRTIELIAHAENYRKVNNLPKIDYEVGTEEVHGGLANLSSFEFFLDKLDAELKALGLQESWPCFVVGKVGTDLHTTYFEPSMARDLTERTLKYGAMVKGHYSDYVDNPEDYPLSGMGGANVGPEFTEEEYYALQDLIKFERKIGQDSQLTEALENAVKDSNRWQKWLFPNEIGTDLLNLTDERRAWIVRTCCRYIWTTPEVLKAREALYKNISPYRDADAFVVDRIKYAIMKYYHAFNLINFNDRMLSI
jgi:tagatose-1,6-bisphosphate aldolase non-catalytic subunit AgaZ/GatZ